MKGGCFLWIIFLLVISITDVAGNQITGESVTGDATQILVMNITVTAYFPTLTLNFPENKTYIINESLLLDFTVFNAVSIWYNLDNSGNITINSSTTFNASQGSHILYLYANSSFGNVTERNVSFLINSSKLTIVYDEYKSVKKGESTDFINFSYESLQTMSNIIFENTDFGRIISNEIINVTDDEDFLDSVVDLDTHTNISLNRIELNSLALPNFNKSSTLYLYNLNFSNPRILRDGSVCQAEICTKISYSFLTINNVITNGTLIFNVTGFSVYSAEETPEGEIPSVSPSVSVSRGGGGGAWGDRSVNFSVDSEEIKVSLKQGETKKKEIIITNTGDRKITITLENLKLKEFIKLSEEEFELNSRESKTITLDIIAREDTRPDLYLGKIFVKGGGIQKEILTAIEVESKKILFDVMVEIPRKFKIIFPGEEVLAKVEIFNLGEIKRGDIVVEYIIKSEDGEVILIEEETLAVETRVSLVKLFQLPEDLELGNYVIYVKVTHKDEVGSASEWFLVVSEKPSERILIYVGLIFGLIILLILISILVKRKKRKTKK